MAETRSDKLSDECDRLRAVNAELVVALEVAYENMRLVNTNAVTGAKLQRFIDATLKVMAAIQLSKAGAK